MLRFCLYFLSFFYTVNSFSTEKKQEEKIKCYSCDKIVMTIPKNNENNYTVEKPFASLSCIFACGCNSFFLCKDCYEKNKLDECPNCKKKNNENNEFENNENENNENDDYMNKACSICYKAYIKTSPLGTYSFFYDECRCTLFICKTCYNLWRKSCQWQKKCPTCTKKKDEEDNYNVMNEEDNHNVMHEENKFDAMNEENKINEDQKNCCQICTECIKDCFIDC